MSLPVKHANIFIPQKLSQIYSHIIRNLQYESLHESRLNKQQLTITLYFLILFYF